MPSAKSAIWLEQAKAAWPGEWTWSDDAYSLYLKVTPLISLRIGCWGFFQVSVYAYLTPKPQPVCVHVEAHKSVEALLENCRTLLQGLAVDLRAVPKTTCLTRYEKRWRRRTSRSITA
jgi:hypothetical protein